MVLPGQVVHAPPVEPQPPTLVPATQVPVDEQQPPLHSWLGVQLVVQRPVDVSHAWLAAQSLALVQPHAPDGRQALPLALPTQLAHTLPVAPHTICDVPGMQVPLVADEQQPDRHAIPVEQVLTQSWFVQPVEVPGQSATAAQPHCPPPVTATHLCPIWLFVQSPQSAPLLPQATPSVPVWQLPPVAAEQQPPLHGVMLSQAEPHWCVVVLHA